MTEEQYEAMGADFADLTNGEGLITHTAWTEAFTAVYGADAKDMISVYETIFAALDLDGNDAISVCCFSFQSHFLYSLFTLCSNRLMNTFFSMELLNTEHLR